jgi:cobalamin biosynthesis Mg chelatase CobN
VFVPKGTKRLENPVVVSLTLERDNAGNKTCYLQISAIPHGNATLSIKPSVRVRFIIYQGILETSYPSSSGRTGFISIQPTTTRIQTTTTTTRIETTTPTTQPSLQQTTTTIQQPQAQQKAESRTNFVLVIAEIVVVVILVVFIYLKYKII